MIAWWRVDGLIAGEPAGEFREPLTQPEILICCHRWPAPERRRVLALELVGLLGIPACPEILMPPLDLLGVCSALLCRPQLLLERRQVRPALLVPRQRACGGLGSAKELSDALGSACGAMPAAKLSHHCPYPDSAANPEELAADFVDVLVSELAMHPLNGNKRFHCCKSWWMSVQMTANHRASSMISR